jgi:predicted RNA-binding protein with RPS1 domain
LYDGVYRKEREMRDKMKRWNGFEEWSEKLSSWIEEKEDKLKKEMEIRKKIDEKR